MFKLKSKKYGNGYNERLFSGGLRKHLHLARYRWFLTEIKKRNCPTDSILELGCFDGKLINFLPQKPLKYVGFDANWEGGLDLAVEYWKDHPYLSFYKASTPEEMNLDKNEVFNIAVVMETFEHVPPQLVDSYLKKIADHLNGYLFITVPNEKGVVFLSKWLTKKILRGDTQNYSFSELINATLGRMTRVARHDHKGFDYSCLIEEVKKHFDILEVSGHPIEFLPHSLSFGIGIVAKSKH